MENQRLFLFFALILVLFLIWQAWNEEKVARLAPPASPVTAVTPSAPAGATGGEAAAPRHDVPGSPQQALPAVPGGSTLKSGTRIHVQTDVYDIVIDSVGGDLRQAGLRTYPQSIDHRDRPFVLMQDGSEFYIAQSGLVASEGEAPDHYAVYSAEQTDYRLADGQDRLEVPLVWTSPSGVKVTKTYTFHRGSFVIDLDHRVVNASAEPWRGSQYRQLQRTGVSTSVGIGQTYTYTGGVVSTPEKNYEKLDFASLAKQDFNQDVTGGWLAMIQHYFVSAIVPNQGETNAFYSRALGDNRFVLGMRGAAQSVDPGASADFATRLYVGPKLQDELAKVAPHLELTVDYGKLTLIAQPLFWALKHIHGLIGNWGWSIIILTVLIKLAFFKLSETSYRSMARMRTLAPKMQDLKQRYGDDKQKLNQAMMELYKKEKVNPLGGCLPIVVQIPVFIALYWMLLESVELRQAPWLGWIADLSAQDPFYVLPIIMGATMVIQQRLNPPPPDPVQAKVMMFLPVLFTFMFLWFPSGLVLYWVVNNTLSILQQWVITRRVEAGKDAATA
ncbi:protein translocase subunit yidC [Plasticicumulans lactativorans]|uniref:Membrane protein insertase YidC n=1 Tax=Plasticicumulans lactativorans TaxID=1133106 RepID=A0A4R2LI14_9GAMM|nr:membrane protein insertase YidC [Plasticicumulans lactativorans]TCO82781.1 protein translocase subunit yidC [Plasticicumulans lactativorans]